ncbi:MAG TPA: FadR/GntR family transcriptional regulator [Acidisphaera sp.]|nr:FadR/GntR family transcriptional regulator [Acidisphaera sp.]
MPALLRPLKPPRNRVAEVAGRIAEQIAAGRYTPGDRLPTEQQMMEAMGVSRTVIREAVAALRADGMVVTRQGAGAFVAAARLPFRISAADVDTVSDVLDIMELRTAVEMESSGLAAERGSPSQLRAVARSCDAIERAMARDEMAIEEDAAFHRAIARASGNPQFVRFLDYLGSFIIPRYSIRAEPDRVSDQQAYMRGFQAEHREIDRAIQARDPQRARQAMRTHLTNSQARYRALAQSAKM